MSIARQELVQTTGSNLPFELAHCFIKALNLEPFHIRNPENEEGFSVLLPQNCQSEFAKALRGEYLLSPIDLSEAKQGKKEVDGYAEVAEEDLKIVEAAGDTGLCRIASALLSTGSTRAKITCVEVYGRNRIEDPHAEPFDKDLSSVPTMKPGTQYPGRLKIITLKDGLSTNYIAIGVRDFNYLIAGVIDKIIALFWEGGSDNNLGPRVPKKKGKPGATTQGSQVGCRGIRANKDHIKIRHAHERLEKHQGEVRSNGTHLATQRAEGSVTSSHDEDDARTDAMDEDEEEGEDEDDENDEEEEEEEDEEGDEDDDEEDEEEDEGKKHSQARTDSMSNGHGRGVTVVDVEMSEARPVEKVKHVHDLLHPEPGHKNGVANGFTNGTYNGGTSNHVGNRNDQ
ncbi:hypothetical protein BGZ94_007195 [Podila epigama]|nr:hypothetical protein BGZ94_007195 [Podila epigama]